MRTRTLYEVEADRQGEQFLWETRFTWFGYGAMFITCIFLGGLPW